MEASLHDVFLAHVTEDIAQEFDLDRAQVLLGSLVDHELQRADQRVGAVLVTD